MTHEKISLVSLECCFFIANKIKLFFFYEKSTLNKNIFIAKLFIYFRISWCGVGRGILVSMGQVMK